MVIFFNFSFTSSHLHPLQVKNYDSNMRLEEDEDDNGKFGLERVKKQSCNKVEIKIYIYTVREKVHRRTTYKNH